jgi:ABC-type sugar transport system substrate-binding protein
LKKIIVAVLVLLLLMASVTGCGRNSKGVDSATTQSSSSQGEKTQEVKHIKIGVSMKNLSDEFVKTIANAMKAKADELGVQLVMFDAQGQLEKELANVEDLITQKVDVLVLNPFDAEGSGAAVDAAKKAGIPVVLCNTLTNNKNYDVYVGSMDEEAGRIQGEFLGKVLNEKGNVGVLMGVIGQSPQIYRKQGLEESLFAKYPRIKKVAEQTANWKRDEAMRITEDWLLRFPEINAIAAQNDDMAMGALQAVQAKGRKDIIIVGIDAIPDALQAVKEGKLAATVFQDAKGQGSKAIEVAWQLTKGISVDKNVIIPFQLVTKENANAFMGRN